jgi:hypothetical protein
MQRRLLGPAFTTRAVRVTTPIFFQKAEELKDRWDTLLSGDIHEDSLPSSPIISMSAVAHDLNNDETVLDIAHWASRATFDVMGLAGFDYHFHSLRDESEEVYLAYRRMFNVTDKGTRLRTLLRIYFPFVEKILVSLRFKS